MTSLRDAAENATAGVSVVRGLVWRQLTSPREDGPPEPTGDIEAQTMIGEYSVCVDEAAIDDAGDDWKWCVWTPVESLGHFADLEEAKAAAQADYEQRILSAVNPDYASALDTARAEIERLKGDGWVEGVPQSPWSKEWFIAETVYGDRVVLKALPEEYTYDFKTADDTYIMARNIKRWMPFPDSEYVSPSMSSALTAAQERIAEQHRALELAEGRIALLLHVFPDPDGESDHPTATQYVLDAIRATLSPAVKEPK